MSRWQGQFRRVAVDHIRKNVLVLIAIFAVFISTFLPLARARAQTPGLTAVQWDTASGTQKMVDWKGEGVTLNVPPGAPGTARIVSKLPLSGDFIADITYELTGWQSGVGTTIAMGFGIDAAKPGQSVQIGRQWSGALDEYRTATIRSGQTRLRVGVINVDPVGRLRVLRRGGQVRVAFQVGPGWNTLQLFDMYANEPVKLFLYATNTGEGAVSLPPVQVRFRDLKVEMLPALKSGSATGTQANPTGGAWALYATGPGWLHVGTQKEVAAPQKTRDEIYGGESDAPLAKTVLQAGFATRAEAVAFLCERLTKVTLLSSPTSQPHEVVRGIFDTKEYYLRLVGANDPEALTKAENYDLAAEQAVLKEQGLTPRRGFGKQWLIHITGHGTVDGDVRDDAWVLFNRAPVNNSFEKPDGTGGTFSYRCDKWEGPYRDNFGLARAMKRLNVSEIALYPPGSSYTPKVMVAEVPDNPRDYGTEVLGVQPIVDTDDLSNWVVYLTGGVWLHVGTRSEFEYPVTSKETLWAGPGDEVMQRESIPVGEGFASYEDAMFALTGKITDVRSAFHPTAEPRETVVATLNGKEVHLHVARDPDLLLARYGNYNYAAEVSALKRFGKTPSKKFTQQWLVHANSVGTYNGDQKRDLWMMVGTAPKNNGVSIPDGDGGSFSYSLDSVEGPFVESGPLASALKAHGLKSIRLYGEDRSISADEATVGPTNEPSAEKPEILSIAPDKGEPGQTFYITVIATGMKPGYRLRFGPGITVTNETYLGKNPDGPGERWLATITIDKDTSFRSGQ